MVGVFGRFQFWGGEFDWEGGEGCAELRLRGDGGVGCAEGDARVVTLVVESVVGVGL